MPTRVIAASRLHAGLLDLGNATGRRYGGVGFMINRPGVTVTVSRSRSWELASDVPLDGRGQHQIHDLFRSITAFPTRKAAAVRVTSLGPQHVGLGTKTGLILAVLAGINRELDLRLSRTALQQISGRGGTSGIGIHGFFLGGLIADAGHSNDRRIPFEPSGAIRPPAPPLLIQRVAIPAQWRFLLILPRGRSWTGRDEIRFFKANTPVRHGHVLKAIACTYHGILPAVSSSDLSRLRTALMEMHAVGFKACELRAQTHNVRALYRALLSIPTVAVGLSSLGPLLYVIADAHDRVALAGVRRVSRRPDIQCLGIAHGARRGFRYLP